MGKIQAIADADSLDKSAIRNAGLPGVEVIDRTSAKDRYASHHHLLLIFLVLLWTVPILMSRAAAEEFHLAQMVHTSWTAREGAPQRITCLAQARDGSLWVGSDGGLYRFDGLSFVLFHSRPGEPAVPPGLIRSLLVSRDGTLWVGTRTGGLIKIHEGHVSVIRAVDDVAAASFHRILQAPDGTLWALAESKPARLGSDGRWHRVASSLNLPDRDVKDIFFDRQGTLWIAQTPELYYVPAGSSHAVKSDVLIGVQPSLTQTPSGGLLVTDLIGQKLRGRLIELNRTGVRPMPVTLSGEHNALFLSSDGFLWIARADEGLVRLRFSGPSGNNAPDVAGQRAISIDSISAKDGLSSDTMTCFLEDAQGNIWTGGILGLDRFQRPRLVPMALHAPKGELFAVDTDSSGTLWIGVPGVGLYSVHGSTLRLEYGKRNYWGVFCGPDRLVWFDDDAGLWQLRDGRAVFIRPLYPATPTTLFQVVQQKANLAFASLQNRNDHSLLGAFRIEGGQWIKIDFAVQGNASDPHISGSHSGTRDRAPTIMLIDSRQRLWSGYSDGSVSLADDTHHTVFSSGTPGLGVVGCLLETKQGIFAAGTNGLAIWRGQSFEMLNFEDADIASGVSGLVRARNGDIWLNGRLGIGRIPHAELEAGLADPQHPMVTQSITEGDFVGPAPFQLRHRTAFADGDGMLWFVAPDGSLLHVDPQNISSPLPQLSIVNTVADGVAMQTDNRIPPKPNTILIRYFGVDLSFPEKVRYRYKLDGVDKTWQDVGRRTEAVYTRLRPAQYTFRVQASNGSGVWTPVTSSVPFTVLPSFYQTTWFLFVCVSITVLSAWLVLHLRVQQVAARVRELADERAIERIRIARDLHDTLLQGVQILLLTFQTVTDKIAVEESNKAMLNEALSRAEMVIAEGRSQVRRLRSDHPSSANLVNSLQAAAHDLNSGGIVHCQVQPRGAPRALRDVVAEEMHFIAREALTNSFRHSGATSIQIDLDYGMGTFTLVCRDNGRGFDAKHLQLKPIDGHWGLRGMAERADAIEATFLCESCPGVGTEISVSIPAARAYLGGPSLASRFKECCNTLGTAVAAWSSTLRGKV